MRWWKRKLAQGEDLWRVLRGQVYRAVNVEELPAENALH